MNILCVSSIPYDKRVQFGNRFPDEISSRMQYPIFYFRAIHLGFYYLDFILGIFLSIPVFFYQVYKHKIDVIYCFIPYLLPIVFLTRKPVVFIAVDDYEGGVYTRKVKRWVYLLLKDVYINKCIACISTTETVKEKLMKINPTCYLIRVGLDVGMFNIDQKEGKQTSIPILHYHGKLRENYHVDVLIKATALVKHEVKLHIIGSGPEHRKLEYLADHLRINAKFYGKRPFNDIPKLTAEATICLLPIDLLAMKLYQYCAAAKPIIAVRGAQTEELLEDGENALLVNKTPEAFAAKIDLLLDNPELMAKLGKKAQAMIQSQDWSFITKRFKILEQRIEKSYNL